MSGIIGSDNSHDSQGETPVNTTIRPAEKPINSTPGPGRPKKSSIENETRATFVVSADLLRKMKYISLMEDKLQQEVLNEALSSYVSKWEEENHKIKMPKKQ